MSDWISVKDRMPKKSGKYLVWTENTSVETCHWLSRCRKWRGGAWTTHITHWMPLLEPKKRRTEHGTE